MKVVKRWFRSKLTWGAILVLLLASFSEKIASHVISPVSSAVIKYAQEQWDDYGCKGRLSMDEADQYSERALTEPARRAEYFRSANTLYAQAYSCGFPDAGLRLAVAHCMGLGTEKNVARARQLVLEIEARHSDKVGRASDVRKACGW